MGHKMVCQTYMLSQSWQRVCMQTLDPLQQSLACALSYTFQHDKGCHQLFYTDSGSAQVPRLPFTLWKDSILKVGKIGCQS